MIYNMCINNFYDVLFICELFTSSSHDCHVSEVYSLATTECQTNPSNKST